MHAPPPETAEAERLSQAFDHSITWEDDVWRADPVDVPAVHAKARAKFNNLITALTGARGPQAQARILLFHGQSGAGKTHLIRALRTSSHRQGTAYFGYAQMTPDVSSYADYYLRRLIASLEKPYDPDRGGESGLARLTRRLVAGCDKSLAGDIERLGEAALDEAALARLVLRLADEIAAAPAFCDQDLDVNVIRALLYLQRSDPRIDQRVRQYLQGRQLTELSHAAVQALDPATGDGRAFEIMESLGRLMWTVDRAVMVFCIDQVEDLRFFPDPEERFQRAVRDLIQIANRVPTSVCIISVLEDFYGQVRGVLAQSYIDRIEKSGPVALLEARTAEEARLIIAERLKLASTGAGGVSVEDPSRFFSPQFFEEFSGLSTRRLLEHAQSRLQSQVGAGADPEEAGTGAPVPAAPQGMLARLTQALGFGGNDDRPSSPIAPIDFRMAWDRFSSQFEAEAPPDDAGRMDDLIAALTLAKAEAGGELDVTIERLELADDLSAFDLTVRSPSAYPVDARVFVCDRPTQGGGLKRQLDRALANMASKRCFMLRTSDFPANKKNQTAQVYRKYRDAGGRSLQVTFADWERMITIRAFHAQHRHDPGFLDWYRKARLMLGVLTVAQLLGGGQAGAAVAGEQAGVTAAAKVRSGAPSADAQLHPHSAASDRSGLIGAAGNALSSVFNPSPADLVMRSDSSDWAGFPETGQPLAPALQPANDDELPLSEILDEGGSDDGSIVAGREMAKPMKPVRLNKNVLKRHSAVLGGSGSGKTTLALSIIEQLLLRGIPAVLIDRKGDLCSYARSGVWRQGENEGHGRLGEVEKFADAIDVAIYTPGRASGRPISITLLPNGIAELPEHEQQLLANLSAAALGDMLHLKNSATHQKQSGTLSVALKILGSRSRSEVTLADLIHLLEDEDPELSDLTHRMDPTGKFRRDLVAQLDSLRHRNSSLFEGGGENLTMEALLGRGAYARSGLTRLSVIYTGFLGDNENILFWVSQFLAEALRFCQRNPNDELQAIVMFDEADLYIPANAKPATAEPLQSLLKRARSAGLGIMLATQSPGDLDYRSRDQITSWFIGRVREDTALKKLKAAFQSTSGLDAAAVLPGQTVGEFHLIQEGHVRAMKAQRSLITAEQVPFDVIEQLARKTKGHDERQLRLFDMK